MRKAVGWFSAILFAVIVLGLVSRTFLIGGDSGPVFAGIYVAAGYLAAIFASIFGVALGNGSREPTQILWVLPIARWKIAVQVMAADLLGTTAAFASAYAILFIVLLVAAPPTTAEKIGFASAAEIAMALAMAYAAYGWSALVGVVGRRVPYCGLVAMPALMVWLGLAQSPVLIGSVFRQTAVANPFAVFDAALTLNALAEHRGSLDVASSSLSWLGATWATPVLAGIAIATCGFAAIVWQRAEILA